MKEIRIAEHGGPEVLSWQQTPAPEQGPGQVRVRVRAVGLNHLDLWVRRGVPGHRFPLPLTPGSDIAGEIQGGPRDGERVCIAPAFGCGSCGACQRGQENLCRRYVIRGEGGDGGLCEELVVPERDLLSIPEHLSFVQAASLPLSGLTAWQMLRKAQLQAGETALILGGTSGVGHLAIQIATAMGARVLATAGTPEKRMQCLELGAEQAFPHRDNAPFHRQVKAATGGAGADVVMEHIGAATWARSLKSLAWGGRLVTCGATTGAEVEINLRALFFKQQSLIGSTMGTRADLLAYWSQVQAGRIQPMVGAEFGWGDLAQAHQALERGVVGKVVVRVD